MQRISFMLNSKFLNSIVAFTASVVLAIATGAFAVEKKKIDFVIGVDGDFKAAMNKAASAGASESSHFVIFFPDGEYEITKLTGDEHGKSTFSPSHVSIVGQSVDKTIVWNTTNTEGISTTATLYFPKNNDMYMQDITLQNRGTYNSGNASRQVALQQNEGDKFIYKNVRLLSGQDTYYTKKGRTYWEGGEIDGTVDFICGGGDVFFEGTKLVMTRNGGYITASQNPGDWGYVFNNAIIEVSNSSFNKTFYLGRSWGRAKVIFLNTIMRAEPKAEGWGPDMNSAPQIFAEYNSKNASGGAINTSQRKTRFDGGKDPSTATTLKTVWNANDAAKYTLANVLKGSDNWDPTKLTAQVNAPKISQEGAEIVWADDNNARAWVVFVNGKYKANVTAPSFALDGVAVGSKITVRAANSMGGLGAYSNEVTTVDATATYYKVTIGESIGGTVKTNIAGDKVMEGKKATFTAVPNEGWKFDTWIFGGKSGKSTADLGLDGSKATLEITAESDIELTPTFVGDGTNKFQAEAGIVENAIIESTNAGFEGTGYINFGTGKSNVQIPIYIEYPGEYTMTMTYANGSGKARDLAIAAPGKCTAGIDGCKGADIISFDDTEKWTTYKNKETTITLPKGANYITFAIVDGNDGPNLDQITLTEKNVEKKDTSTIAIPQILHKTATIFGFRIYNTSGKLIRHSKGAPNLSTLPHGIYIVRTSSQGKYIQKLVHVH